MTSSHHRNDHDTAALREHGDIRHPRWPLFAWLILVVGLLIWLGTGSVSTTSYTYNPFLNMTFRDVSETSIQEIWTYQTEHLPDVRMQQALDLLFILCIVVIIVCVVAGCWLLLVQTSDPSSHGRGRARHVSSNQLT